VSLPAISVLLPVFNAERYLGAALESVLAQTFTDFECVIVDDGSTDTSPTILAQYAAHDGRIRIIRQENMGIVAALNRGLAECRAPLVARMDADDICLPQRLATQLDYLDKHPEVVAVGTAFQLMSAAGVPGPVVRHPRSAQTIRRGLRSGNRLGHPTVVMRRDAVLAAGGYREALRHAEDYDLWTRLAEGYRLANLPECLLLYQIHGGQISWSQAEAQAMATLAVRGLAAQRMRAGRELLALPRVVDMAFLSSLGFSVRDQEDALVACAAGRITNYAAVNMSDEAAAARAALVEFAERSGSRSIRRSVTARLAWADFVEAWRNGRWLRAIRSLGSCACAGGVDSKLLSAAVRRFTTSSLPRAKSYL